ncbi:hypothetical protein BpOF4_20359 (plasmid) [Alkalihalophilus pseudofirmus OF4]|uniref:Uncharacterized protein n=1 Tax=Alkalihalophilus pseudofirmus (strain ATCC BAA-2126 / JCM 17055 / OF4) TaxID=398511 RepID=D3G143_ALKPO|nr:hypothetical protein BpOF4_20359 [Alkalihalophilus pseudofirmus OF4]
MRKNKNIKDLEHHAAHLIKSTAIEVAENDHFELFTKYC